MGVKGLWKVHGLSLTISLWDLIMVCQILEPAEELRSLSDFTLEEGFHPECGSSTLRVGVDIGWVR